MEMLRKRLQGVWTAVMLGLLLGMGAIAGDAFGQGGAAVRTAATGTKEKTEEEQKTAWQKRMAEAKQQLAEAQARKLQLEQKRDSMKYEWAGPGSARTNEMIDADLGRTNAELQEAQRAVNDATDLIENVIPDEARKAGIPPGWLRE